MKSNDGTDQTIAAATKEQRHFGALHFKSGIMRVVNRYEGPASSAFSAPAR
jgi:hypothetical protein